MSPVLEYVRAFTVDGNWVMVGRRMGILGAEDLKIYMTLKIGLLLRQTENCLLKLTQ